MFYTFGTYVEKERLLSFLKKMINVKDQPSEWVEKLILHFLLTLSEADELLKKNHSQENIKETPYYQELTKLYQHALDEKDDI